MAYRILVGLDESAWGQHAAEMGMWIAARSPEITQITGLHVVNVTRIRGRILEDLAGMLGFEPVVVPAQAEALYRNRGNALLEAFALDAEQAGLRQRTELEQGSITDRLAHHTALNDLLVMGTLGDTEAEFPGQGGGHAQQMSRKARCSTLLVPGPQDGLNGILLGYDGSDGSARALRAAARLAEVARVPLDVVHVADRAPTTDPLKEAKAQLQDFPQQVAFWRVEGEPHEALPAEAVRRGRNLLALGFRGRSRLTAAFLGRTTEWLIGRLELPLLIAR